MMTSTYLRIETRAGGLGASPREFVRAAHKSLRPEVRRSFAHRSARHQFLRDVLRQRDALLASTLARR